MNDAQSTIETALSEIERLRASIKARSTTQVQSNDECAVIKATAFSWYNRHRPILIEILTDAHLSTADKAYNELMALSDRNTSRAKYSAILKNLRTELVNLRAQNIVVLSKPKGSQSTSDVIPDFSGVTSDVEMQAILTRRWNECIQCTSSRAPLAATVMMGGLLEALFLARINQLADKSSVFKAKATPIDKKSGNPLPLSDWGLKDFINVAHELGWISQTVKDVGSVLRDYRNYIHPYKERSHGIKLESKDAAILWELSKSISRQLLS